MLAHSTPTLWNADPALAWVGSVLLLYWLGGRGTSRSSSGLERWRTASFVGGLTAIVVAVGSPIDPLAERLLWVHMVQHVLLLLVAPPLLALARPWNRIWRGVPLAVRRPVARAVVQRPSLAPLRAAAGALASPLPSWLLFNVTLLAWHLPFAYGATLESPVAHATEHAMFFATGLLFWSRVIDSPPWRSAMNDAGRAVYAGAALVPGWALAVALAFSPEPLYSSYAAETARPGGISALADQQLAAGVMWVPGSIPLTVAALFLVYRWLESKPEHGAADAAIRGS